MTTSTVASTTLDFLETVPPKDSIWDAGGVEALILQISSLAILKRNERQTHGVSQAVSALQAEADSLSSDGIDIDLGPVQSADLASIAPASILPRIEELLTAIAAYRKEAKKTTDGSSRTIAEHKAAYQSVSSSLSQIIEKYEKLIYVIPVVVKKELAKQSSEELTHRRRGKSTTVSRELWTVAYFLASCGHRVDDGPAVPPLEFGPIGWGSVFVSFHHLLGAGRDQEQFRKSLSNLRDYYDAFVDSGRKGWNPETSKMPRLGHIVMTDWQNRPREELWEYVKQFVTR